MPLRPGLSSGPRRPRPPLTETGILLCCAGLLLCPLAGLVLTGGEQAAPGRGLFASGQDEACQRTKQQARAAEKNARFRQRRAGAARA